MAIQILENRFLAWQEQYYQSVIKVPSKVTLITETQDLAATPYDTLTKTTTLTQTRTIVRCLWKRQFTPYERTKMGLSEDCTGALYIPPKELVLKFGTFQLDFHKVLIQLEDFKYNELYVVDTVRYMSPMYNTCIAVELHLKSQITA